MIWNWLAWNKAYQMPAGVPKAFCTPLPNKMSANAFNRPKTARTIQD
jgi:hypothetical protein